MHRTRGGAFETWYTEFMAGALEIQCSKLVAVWSIYPKSSRQGVALVKTRREACETVPRGGKKIPTCVVPP
jgi:hypothetical protein